MKKYMLVALFVAAVVYGCKHEVANPSTQGTTNPVDTTGTANNGNTAGNNSGGSSNGICFERDILPIFSTNCAKSGCHDVQSHEDGYVFDTYANIMMKDVRAGNADGSKVYRVLVDPDPNDRMPQYPNPPLSSTQIALIKQWINEGAQNATNCTSNCDPNAFTYLQTVKPIIDANCLGCHNSSLASGGLDYSTYAGLQAVALNGRLLGAITHAAGFTPMPYNRPKLSDCNIDQITKWVNAGAPNN